MVMHITGHSNIDCYVTRTAAGSAVFVKTCVALKFMDDDDDDDDDDDLLFGHP